MATDRIEIALRSWAADGRGVGDDFVSAIALEPSDGYAFEPRSGAWQSSLLRFVDLSIETYADQADPESTLQGSVEKGLVRAAQWLARRPGLVAMLQARGIAADVVVDASIRQGQFDLALPAEFLLACGTAGLSITLVTND